MPTTSGPSSPCSSGWPTSTQGPTARCRGAATRRREAQLRRELEQGRLGRPHFETLIGRAGELRDRLAEALGCDPLEVALTRSTTDGVATVLATLELGPGDEVLTSDLEHPGLLAPLELARRRRGFDVRFVPFDELASEVGSRTKLVACSHVCWADGRIVDVEGLKATGVQVLLDGAQGLGAIPLDMRALGCDFYAASGQKWLCGPDGSGCLYVRREVAETLDPPWPGYGSLAEPNRASELIPHPGARRFDMGVPPGPPTAWSLAALELFGEAGLDWMHSTAADGAERLAGMLRERGVEVVPRGAHDARVVAVGHGGGRRGTARLRGRDGALPSRTRPRARLGGRLDERRGPRAAGDRALKAECLRYQDQADAGRGFLMDDQRLGEQASRAACGLHAHVLPRQAVLAYAAEAFVDVADQLLVADNEDHVPAGVCVRAELAARAGADDDLAVVGDRVGES